LSDIVLSKANNFVSGSLMDAFVYVEIENEKSETELSDGCAYK